MLNALTIRNVVLIDHLDLDFDAGFSVLTGETGAGKSILLDSLGLVLGARADSKMIRKGADKASVTAIFQGPFSQALQQHLRDIEVDWDSASEDLIIRRVVTDDGRSKAFINDQNVSVGALKNLASGLVDIHSQFETHALLDPKTHLSWLDRYMNDDALLAEVKQAWANKKTTLQGLAEFEQELAAAQEQQEYWEASLEALDMLNPQLGEEEALLKIREQTAAREQILDRLGKAAHALRGNDGAVAQANKAWKFVEKCPLPDESLLTRLDQCLNELSDISDAVQEEIYAVNTDNQSVDKIDDRLIELRAEARKHDCKCDDLPAKRDELAQKIGHVIEGGAKLTRLRQAKELADQQYHDDALRLSAKRQKTAETLSQSVMTELAHLKLDKARFVVDVLQDADYAGPQGVDQICFTIAANPGQSPAPIHKAASGGELSRIMLAMKIVFADIFPVQTMVFDEIDAGMGGATADALAQRLYALSRNTQLLTVTHAPQIAALGDGHYIVSKGDVAGVTRTDVTYLDNRDQRREEIARMLSGAEITVAARTAAESLMNGHHTKKGAA